jgi:hypothetical protein
MRADFDCMRSVIQGSCSCGPFLKNLKKAFIKVIRVRVLFVALHIAHPVNLTQTSDGVIKGGKKHDACMSMHSLNF